MLFNIQSKLLFSLLVQDINYSCCPSVAFLKSVSINSFFIIGIFAPGNSMIRYISACKTIFVSFIREKHGDLT